MQSIERFALTFLINAVWQTSIVIAVAACWDRFPRSTDARYRHIVWVTAFVLGLLLPLASAGRISVSGLQAMRHADPAQVRGPGRDSDRIGNQTFSHFELPASTLGNDANTHSSRLARVVAPIRAPLRLPPLLMHIVLGGYFISVLIQSVRLARAIRLTDAIRRGAKLLALPVWAAHVVSRCERAFGLRHLTILHSPEALGPVTLGARQPVIILPEGLFQATAPDDLAAALCHEMAHIRRHDFGFNMLYELLYLPVSFHPAARLARRRIDETREIACDEMAAGRALDASTYARSLLNIARNMSNLPSAATAAGPGYTLSVFDADILEERIMNLLNKAPRIDPRLARGSLGLALVLLVVSFLGAAAFPLGVTHTDRSKQVSSETEGAARDDGQPQQHGSLSGTVFDPSGARVPNAGVKLIEGVTGESLSTTTDDTGHFSLDALAFGKYKLEITKPGFTISADHEVTVAPGKSTGPLGIMLYVGETLQMVIVAAKAPPGVQQQIAKKGLPQRIRIGGLVESAKLVKRQKPDYPESIRQKGIQGIVVLSAVISKEGVPIDWKVLSSPDPALSESAVNAFKGWRYKPTLLNGQPVEVATTLAVEFRLEN